MSKILLVVAIILSLGAGVVGFLTKGKIGSLRTEIADKDRTINDQTAKIAKADAELKTAKEDLATSQAKLQQAESDLASSRQEAQSLKSKVTEAEARVAQQQTQIDELTQKLAAAPAATGEPTATADVADIQNKLKETETQLAEAKTLNDSLTAKIGEMDSQMAALREKAEQRDRQIMAKGLQGQVLAVNQAWNFVVLSIGDRQGVVQNAQMLVVRGGQTIGRLKITSVEPSTSIADVIPGSLSQGVRVQPGDQVIYPGA